jgi:FkbM family methyltransferase
MTMTNFYTRPGTYDEQVVEESSDYLALRPCEPDILLDIGANIGAVSKRFLLAGISRVICVEPEPRNYALLERNLSPYQGRHHLINAAAASSNGHRELWLSSDSNKGKHSLVRQSHGSRISVAVVSLRELLDSHDPTLLKVDIEGGEYELEPTMAKLPATVRGVALELHFAESGWRSRLAPILIRSLEEQGFMTVRPPDLRSPEICSLGICLRR